MDVGATQLIVFVSTACDKPQRVPYEYVQPEQTLDKLPTKASTHLFVRASAPSSSFEEESATTPYDLVNAFPSHTLPLACF